MKFIVSLFHLKTFISTLKVNLCFCSQVFTSSISNDGMSMDLIQVLGNAFLKLTISVYAYKCCLNNSSRSMTSLQKLQTAFMSKRNLANCSIRNHLCNRIKVTCCFLPPLLIWCLFLFCNYLFLY